MKKAKSKIDTAAMLVAQDNPLVTFDGAWVDGLAEGHGTARYVNDHAITGTMHKGLLHHGEGVCPEWVYSGEFRDNVPHGQGETRLSNGIVYNGQFCLARPNGFGTMSDERRGWIYEGEIRKGQYCGTGVFVLERIAYTHEGHFRDDHPCGQGKLSTPIGTWEGQFTDWQTMVGEARISSPTRSWEYEGHVRGVRPHGHGVLRYNGITITGKFSTDGENAEIRADGHGTIEKPGEWHYEGDITRNTANGEGVLKVTGVGECRGTFRDGQTTGEVVICLSDGTQYKGQSEHNSPHGPGQLSGPVGIVGTWHCGVLDEGAILSADGKLTILRNDDATTLRGSGCVPVCLGKWVRAVEGTEVKAPTVEFVTEPNGVPPVPASKVILEASEAA